MNKISTPPVSTGDDAAKRRSYASPPAYNTGHLKVSDRHTIYFEESGNAHGKPAIFVHGGPGSGASANDRRFFNPEKYRLVLFDQRGCGRSTPHADIVDNTTWDLVGDMEKLRQHLAIERWLVFGGSWGSTLSLAYAESHPTTVTELVLRGIFLLRDEEIRWFYQEGANALFPDRWEHFLAPIPRSEQDDLVGAYYRRLCSDDEEIRLEAARAWSQWEGSTITFLPSESRTEAFGSARFATAFARIECHYFVNRGFLDEKNALLNNIDRIRHIPGVIVQGRYDVCTPMRNAWALHRAWPEAELKVVADAGHSSSEPGITHELLNATDKFSLA